MCEREKERKKIKKKEKGGRCVCVGGSEPLEHLIPVGAVAEPAAS